MEQLSAAARFRHRRSPDRFFTVMQQQSNSSPPLELSEDDIFSNASWSSSPSPTHRCANTDPGLSRNWNTNRCAMLAAVNGDLKEVIGSASGSDIRPVFNRKVSALAASRSSSSSTSPATSTSSRMMIPRPPVQANRMRFHHQSAPVNVPASFQRRVMEFDEVVSDEEDGMILPPHEVAAARDSQMLGSSVLEGAGRTLKGRDLRQVRNCIWRKTGFTD